MNLIYAVMVHELGHSLMLEHIINPMSAMESPLVESKALLRLKNYFDRDKLHKLDIDAYNEFYNIED